MQFFYIVYMALFGHVDHISLNSSVEVFVCLNEK